MRVGVVVPPPSAETLPAAGARVCDAGVPKVCRFAHGVTGRAVLAEVLQLCSGLIQGLVTLVPSVAASPLEGGSHWLASLLLGISVLQLARKVPRLMPGYPSLGASTAGQLTIFATRQLASVLSGQRSARQKG